MLDARPVPGTPLVLAQWTRIRDAEGRRSNGMDFTLVDPEWNVVWSHTVRYEPKPGKDYQQIGGRGADLALRSFEIPTEPGKRGRFEVKAEGAGWSVSEVERK